MLYSLYIYKSTAATASAPAIGICNWAVSSNSFWTWGENEAAHFMECFDTHEIAAKIRAFVGEKCQISIRKPPPAYGDVEYIYIATSYVYAPTVLPYIHCVTAENDLALYDAETKRTFFKELINRPLIIVKSRIADYKRMIETEMKPVWRIRKIGVLRMKQNYDYAYIVTLKKDPSRSFADRCADFYRCLESHLNSDEKLSTDNECFTIVSEWYTISFCLEGYKKHANQMGYYDQGIFQTKLIKRMGGEEGFFWLDQNKISMTTIMERMNFREMRKAYPNPANRFIASVNIQKWESRKELGIRYCGVGANGAEILFHVVPSNFYEDGEELSMLAVDEDRAWYILSAVGKFYPYLGDRCYLEENHLPIEMWIDIVEEARKIKEELIHSHNYCEAEILEVFIRWSESQFELYQYDGNGRMLNIQGP